MRRAEVDRDGERMEKREEERRTGKEMERMKLNGGKIEGL